MIAELSPGLVLIFGALLVPFLRGRLRSLYLLILPAAALGQILSLPHGAFGAIEFFGLELVTVRVDKLSLLFSYVFVIATLLGMIYALHVRDTPQQVAALVYAGGALGAVFAGDLVTLFVFWETITLGSVFLIWAARNDRAYRAGLRYLVIQVASGVFLLAGLAMIYRETGSIAFAAMDFASPGATAVFLAFGIKCAFPLLHNWLQDAYPESTVTGTVFLSAFTTKLAVYALARGFAGTEILIPIGAVMTAFPIFYAVIENDLRRVLAYSLNNQLGFMVVGIGVGTELALNGAVAHAFAHIIYKALLFMSMGAVLYRVGTAKGSELGGLYKSMPWTTAFCIVGAASISAFPLFSGFVAKSMILSAVMDEGYFWTWIVLLFASAGVFHHSGIKVPFFAFFGHDSGKRCPEAPANMLVAMAIASVLCILIGLFPATFYRLLPYATPYDVYTLEHVVTQTQLLVFSALAFTVLMRTGIYPPELRSTNLDFDWIYRRLGPTIVTALDTGAEMAWMACKNLIRRGAGKFVEHLGRYYGPEGALSRSWKTSEMAFWTSVVLAGYLLLFFF